MKIESVYIHIPFCLRKCNYCDFVSFPVDSCGEYREKYIDLLLAELALYGEEIDLSPLRTVYLGGGTPSLLVAAEVSRLLEHFPGAEEITLEANPETLDTRRLADLFAVGINRLSMGVQSFQPGLLRDMGRGHSPQQARDMVAAARQAGFVNIGIDLIYALPRQTLEQWQDDLAQALALGVEHISLYGLTVEPQTPWGRLQAAGQLPPVDDDLAADMLELAMDTLAAAGYDHYEISNFARPGFASKHNLAYWRRRNYLGLGVAAAGCMQERRIYNAKTLEQYAAMIGEGRLPVIEDERLDIHQIIGEALFLGLRLAEGIDFAAFHAQYGLDPRRRFHRSIRKLADAGLLAVDERGMCLTRRGLLLGNQVFEAFV